MKLRALLEMASTRQAGLTWGIPDPYEEPPDSRAGILRKELAGIAASYGARMLTKQLGSFMTKAEVAEWVPVISRLAGEAAALLSPSTMTAHGDINPQNYIEVRKGNA